MHQILCYLFNTWIHSVCVYILVLLFWNSFVANVELTAFWIFLIGKDFRWQNILQWTILIFCLIIKILQINVRSIWSRLSFMNFLLLCYLKRAVSVMTGSFFYVSFVIDLCDWVTVIIRIFNLIIFFLRW